MNKVETKILDKALELWPDVTPSKVAKALKLNSHTNVLYYFPRNTLKDRAAEYAVKTENSRVIAQLIATDHYSIHDMPITVRRRHLKATV